MSSFPARDRSRIASALDEQRETAREQLTAAWQLHVSRIEEQLHAGWQEHVAQVFEERFAELAGRIEQEIRTEIEVASPALRERGRREATEELNRAARRLARYQTREEWSAALLDAARRFAGRAALFSIQGRRIGFEELDLPLASAPAVASAVDTRETVVALCAPGELSEEIAARLPADVAARCCLLPIAFRDRVTAVLYADGNEIDVNGLEAVAALGAMALEAQAAARRQPSLLATIAGPGQRSEAEVPLDWAQLSREEQQLHLHAQRFARVRVAEMRLCKTQAVRAGRAQKDLYAELREDIDAAREAYRREFLAASGSMVDYFHLELVRTLANDDVRALGETYPGPLV